MRTVAVKGLIRECSQLVLGTSWFGRANKEDVFKLLDCYIENGGNTIDTSWVYCVDKSERILGEWLKGGNRNHVMIASKGCHHYVDANGVHFPERTRFNPKCITEDLHRSMENMGIDHIDMFLLHRDEPSIPVDEMIEQLETHKRDGLIDAYGVSNWTTSRIDSAIDYAETKGYDGIALNSPSLSLAKIVKNRWEGTVYADNAYIYWHKKNQLPLFSWAAQASGFFHFASQLKREEFPNQEIAETYYSPDNLERLRRLQTLASQRGNNVTPTNLALAYVLNQSFPTCAVIGPQNPAEFLSCVSASKLALSDDQIRWLNLEK